MLLFQWNFNEFVFCGLTEMLVLLGRTTWRLGGRTERLGGWTGRSWGDLGDYCMLLNGLGRFQNALGIFQEAPKRESWIFLHWFWKVFWGARQGRADPGGGLSDPVNQDFSRQTKHHWNWARVWAWATARSWARASTGTRARTRTQGKWAGSPTHAVAQSARWRIYRFYNICWFLNNFKTRLIFKCISEPTLFGLSFQKSKNRF